MKSRISRVALLASISLSNFALAAETGAPSPDPSRAEPPTTAQVTSLQTTTPSLQFSAYFDAYYGYNFNQPPPVATPSSSSPQSTMVPAPQNALHSFDWYSQQLGLNLIEVTLRAQRKEVGLLADLDFGEQADIASQSPTPQATGGPAPSTVDEISKHIGQAVLTYAPEKAPGLVLEAGKMYSHVGLETAKAKDNWNYSRSLEFALAEPIWHTGLHAGYEFVPGKVAAGIFLYQGWNTLFDNNNAGTYGFQLKATPAREVTWSYNYLGGPEQPRNNSNWRQVHETNISWAASQLVSMGLDLTFGYEQNAPLANGTTANAYWGGAEFLAKFQFTPKLALSPRMEVFRDSAGYVTGGDPQTLTAWTLTNSYQVADGFETKLEVRYDTSTSPTRFLSASGSSSTQVVALLGMLFTI